jgi:hypothetical protein
MDQTQAVALIGVFHVLPLYPLNSALSECALHAMQPICLN